MSQLQISVARWIPAEHSTSPKSASSEDRCSRDGSQTAPADPPAANDPAYFFDRSPAAFQSLSATRRSRSHSKNMIGVDRLDPLGHFRIRSGRYQFRDHIRVQDIVHRSTFLGRLWSRSRSSSTPTSGDWRKKSSRLVCDFRKRL